MHNLASHSVRLSIHFRGVSIRDYGVGDGTLKQHPPSEAKGLRLQLRDTVAERLPLIGRQLGSSRDVREQLLDHCELSLGASRRRQQRLDRHHEEQEARTTRALKP